MNIQLVPMNHTQRSVLEPQLTDHFAEDLMRFLAIPREQAQAIAVNKLEEIWKEESGIYLAIINDKDQLCGALIAGAYESRDQITLYELFVDKEFRNLGIGGKALELFEAFSKSKGFSQIALSVMAGNENALKLYRSGGFDTISFLMTKNL